MFIDHDHDLFSDDELASIIEKVEVPKEAKENFPIFHKLENQIENFKQSINLFHELSELFRVINFHGITKIDLYRQQAELNQSGFFYNIFKQLVQNSFGNENYLSDHKDWYYSVYVICQKYAKALSSIQISLNNSHEFRKFIISLDKLRNKLATIENEQKDFVNYFKNEYKKLSADFNLVGKIVHSYGEESIIENSYSHLLTFFFDSEDSDTESVELIKSSLYHSVGSEVLSSNLAAFREKCTTPSDLEIIETNLKKISANKKLRKQLKGKAYTKNESEIAKDEKIVMNYFECKLSKRKETLKQKLESYQETCIAELNYDKDYFSKLSNFFDRIEKTVSNVSNSLFQKTIEPFFLIYAQQEHLKNKTLSKRLQEFVGFKEKIETESFSQLPKFLLYFKEVTGIRAEIFPHDRHLDLDILTLFLRNEIDSEDDQSVGHGHLKMVTILKDYKDKYEFN